MKLSAIILAGGKSSRLGFDKTKLKIGQYTLAETAVQTAESFADEIFLMSNSPDKFSLNNCIELPDEIQGIGPISAVYTAIKKSSNDYSLILACDIVGINTDLIKSMMNKLCDDSAEAIMLVSNGRKQPLCSIVNTDAARKVLSEIINDDNHSLMHMFDQLNTVYYDTDIELYNINTPDDLKMII